MTEVTLEHQLKQIPFKMRFPFLPTHFAPIHPMRHKGHANWWRRGYSLLRSGRVLLGLKLRERSGQESLFENLQSGQVVAKHVFLVSDVYYLIYWL